MEIWKDIEGYEKLYKISNLGRIKSYKKYVNGKSNSKRLIRSKYLIQTKNKYGYLQITIHKNNKIKTISLHKLVALAFIPNPENKSQINHKNGIKTDNRADNLEWCTRSENQKHAFKLELNKGYYKNNKLSPNRKKIIKYDLYYNFIKEYKTIRDAQLEINNKKDGTISSALRGRCKTAYGYIWKYKK